MECDPREAEWLLKERYIGKKSEAFFADVERLKSGEPLAYLIGDIPFLGTTICLDSHPLIPRAETEYWTERAILDIKKHYGEHAALSILDLCAGSGCIGISVLHHLKKVHVDFAEINEKHIRTIQKNIHANEIDSTRTKILVSDLFENVSKNMYDVILTNPPYIDIKVDRTAASVRTFEPLEALYGGELGLDFIQKIIESAEKYLRPNGMIYIEHEPEQTRTIHETALQQGFIADTYKDQYGVDRYTRLARANEKLVRQ